MQDVTLLCFTLLFYLIGYTCTQWVLNLEPHLPPHSLWREEMPFMLELIGFMFCTFIKHLVKNNKSHDATTITAF